jgi:phytanoyl-CoA hydroxylase
MVQETISVTEEDVEGYQERGFIQYPNFFSAVEMGRLRTVIDAAIASNRDRIVGAEAGGRGAKEYEQVFNQMINLWNDSPVAKEFTFSKRLAETGRRLAQAEHVRLYHDHAMVKPGGQESRRTNWHQDAPYWPMDPVGSFSTWIAVDNVKIENGCLHFVPNSHKFGRLERIDLESDNDSIVTNMKDRGFDVSEPEAIELEEGGVTFHHGCNFHFAGPNQTNEPRRAFAIIYIPNNVTYTGGHPSKLVGEGLEPGDLWEHPMHPILSEG